MGTAREGSALTFPTGNRLLNWGLGSDLVQSPFCQVEGTESEGNVAGNFWSPEARGIAGKTND